MQIHCYSHAQCRYIYRGEHFLRLRCSPELYLGLLHYIRFHFLITGHTKFSPDACFGLIKIKCRCTNVSSLDDLAHVVNESAACNLYQLVSGRYTRWPNHRAFPRMGWVSLLPFSPPGWYQAVPSLPHFRFERDHPGVVFFKKTAASEEETCCLLLGDWSP